MYQGMKLGDKMTFQDMFRINFILYDNQGHQKIYSDGKMFITTVNDHISSFTPQDEGLQVRG